MCDVRSEEVVFELLRWSRLVNVLFTDDPDALFKPDITCLARAEVLGDRGDVKRLLFVRSRLISAYDPSDAQERSLQEVNRCDFCDAEDPQFLLPTDENGTAGRGRNSEISAVLHLEWLVPDSAQPSRARRRTLRHSRCPVLFRQKRPGDARLIYLSPASHRAAARRSSKPRSAAPNVVRVCQN